MGILGRIQGRKPKQENTAIALAMVLLPHRGPPDCHAAFDFLRANWVDLPSVVDVDTKDDVVTGYIPGGVVGLLHVPVPIPAGDLAGPTALAWHWPDAAVNVARHQAHVIVSAGSTSLTQVELRLLHSNLVASLTATASGVGVYVRDAMLVRAAEDYVAEARAATGAAVPTMLWVGFNPVSGEGAVSAYTTGLKSFGLRELEVLHSTRSAPEILGRMADAATYELQTGRILGDGETFGWSETERVPIRHARSAFLPDTEVAVLGL